MQYETIESASVRLGDLFTQAGENPLLALTDEEWRIDMAFTLLTLDTSADAILGLNAPNSVSHIDDLAQQMALLIKSSVEAYTAGIDEVDPDKISEGNDYLVYATAALLQMNSAMEEITKLCL